MSCKALKLNSCEIKGSTFAGRKFTFPNRDISEDTFVAKVRGFYNSQTIAEIQGVKDDDGNVYFSKSTLENNPKGQYTIEYWATFEGIATELIAVEDFKISLDACDCGDSENSNFTLTFPEETIEYSVEIAVINIGGGGGSGADGKSAYEIAVENGFVGTEAEWLISLKGEKGDVGPKGDKGDVGNTGLTGPQGLQGPIGVKGDTGDQGLKGDKGDTGNTGLQGDQGIQGTPGVPSYTHIRYSANAAGTGFNTTPNEYIGLANTTSATAPVVNTGYTWYKIKGEQGIQGVAGTNGTSVQVLLATSEANALTLSAANPNNIYYWT